MSETIATMLTGSGRSAVATVMIAGPDALSHVMTRFQPATKSVTDLVLNKIYFGTWKWESYCEELVICRLAEEQLEIHCHGGRLASYTILESLRELGTLVISSTEWLGRMKPDRFVREAVDLLRLVTTEKATAILLDQSRHAMRQALTIIRHKLNADNTDAAISLLEQIVSFGPLGTHLGRPFSVVLVGAPNTGKSSLVNAMMGFDRAIVSTMPGTTRDVVSVSTALEGWPITLTDTAGMRQTNDPVERAGMEMAEQQMQNADLILLVQDLSDPNQDDSCLSLGVADSKSIKVGTKADLAKSLVASADVVTSATARTGIDLLSKRIVDELIPKVPAPGSAVPITAWQHESVKSMLSLLRQGSFDEVRLLLADL